MKLLYNNEIHDTCNRIMANTITAVQLANKLVESKAIDVKVFGNIVDNLFENASSAVLTVGGMKALNASNELINTFCDEGGIFKQCGESVSSTD